MFRFPHSCLQPGKAWEATDAPDASKQLKSINSEILTRASVAIWGLALGTQYSHTPSLHSHYLINFGLVDFSTFGDNLSRLYTDKQGNPLCTMIDLL